MRLLLEDCDGSQPVACEVFRRVRTMILDGEIPPGSRLVERRLAEQFYVSRTPVREALKRLESEGLVCRSRDGGLTVTEVSPADAIEIFTIREVLEGLATGQAAVSRTESDLEALTAALCHMDSSALMGDEEEWGKWNLAFHERIYMAANSPRLTRLLSDVRAYLRRFTRVGFQKPGRMLDSNRGHEEILLHLSEGDAVEAEAAARRHTRRSLETILSALEGGDAHIAHTGDDSHESRCVLN
ncbi:MAG: GntR family transcriptional regulator [Clostridia bacterium]|nr:GntR family transcriptional regulator [Clostridia bacterium]